MTSNPLSQYFRQPSIYITLPSQGKFYPSHALDMPPNGELPVLPMTTIDEITYRTPDALFNGSAVTSVIQSCLPNIKDAWSMPAMDIDTVLVAIRIASFGHELDIETTCPNCKHETDYALDLRRILEKIAAPDYSRSIKHGDLEIFFRPMNYRQLNENNLAQFEEQKRIQALTQQSEGSDQDRLSIMSEILKQITTVTIHALSQSIERVVTPSAQVVEREHIEEWLSQCDRKVFNLVKDHVIKTKLEAELPPLDLKCPSCSHEYQQIFTLDMSNFFEGAS